MLLAQLVYDVARLHKQGWVYGDLSFKNAAFAISPPRMILLDCDGAADLTRAASRRTRLAGTRLSARSGKCRTRPPTSTNSAWPSCAA